MIDKNKKYTSNGDEVKIYEIYESDEIYESGDRPVHGAVSIYGLWHQRSWNLDGTFGGPHVSSYNLVEVKPRIKRTIWLNVYRDSIAKHSIREIAERNHSSDRLALLKVEIDCEEGHIDE